MSDLGWRAAPGLGEIHRWTRAELSARAEVRAQLGFLDPEELGNFYLDISDLEIRLREFIKERIGKGWFKRITNEIPTIVNSWEEKRLRDKRWGIDHEDEQISYADLGDYVQIIRQYKNMFSDSDEDLAEIITWLKIWYNHGRNPIMHARTLNREKYFTTRSAIKFLDEWMRRKKSARLVSS